MLNEYSNILTKAKVYKKVDTVTRIVSIENIVMVNKTIKANKAVGVDSVTKYDWNEHVIENSKDLLKRI